MRRIIVAFLAMALVLAAFGTYMMANYGVRAESPGPHSQSSFKAEIAGRVSASQLELAPGDVQPMAALPKTENFEGSWPNDWQLLATEAKYWGPNECLAYGGSYDGWPARFDGEGYPSHTDPPACTASTGYPYSFQSLMVYGPFSTVGATSGVVDFKALIDTESNYDWGGVIAKTGSDCTDLAAYNGPIRSGDWGDWVDWSEDLANFSYVGNLLGQPNVCIAFAFLSDASVTDVGFFLDNISISTAQGTVTPTPTPPPLPNDNLNSAISIPSVPYGNSQSTVGATAEPGEPDGCGIADTTVWYKFAASTTQFLIADTFGSDYDTMLNVYSGPASATFANLTLVDCNDDSGGTWQSEVPFEATAGTTYYFQIDGLGGATGNLVFNLHGSPPGPADIAVVSQQILNPPGDICVGDEAAILVDKVVHNNGPTPMVPAQLDWSVSTPPGCAFVPFTPSSYQVILPVSVDMVLFEDGAITCDVAGAAAFTWNNEIWLKNPQNTDPNPNNNSLSTPLTVNFLGDCPERCWMGGPPEATTEDQSSRNDGEERLRTPAPLKPPDARQEPTVGEEKSTLTAGEFVPGELIVKFKPGVSSQDREAVVRQEGAVVLRHLLVPGYALVSVPRGQEEDFRGRLVADPKVELAERNGVMRATFVPNDPLYPLQWHMPQVQSEQAWDVANGSGVVVAVIDTGVAYENYEGYQQAPDLAGTSFTPGCDFVNEDYHANDDEGHGTHVTGTIAQTTNNNHGVAGLAHGATIMPVKVLDAGGSGTDADVADGIQWAADYGADVINLSLGDGPSTAIEDALNHALSNGVVVVAAAGNWGTSGLSCPACYPGVLAVGATDYNMNRASYSQYGCGEDGHCLDVMAPGGDTNVDLNGDGYPDGVLQETFGGLGTCLSDPLNPAFGFCFWAGTSMATPHVAGAAALLLDVCPALTPSKVGYFLKANTLDLGPPGYDFEYGNGLLQARNALDHALNTDCGSRSYTLMMEANPPEGGATVPSPGPHPYDLGTEVYIDADPSPGWCFTGWTGDPDCADGDGSVTMDHDMTCTANFSTTSCEVLLVQDTNPWGCASNEQALQELGKVYDVMTASEAMATDLSPYDIVMVPSDQFTGTYDTLAANVGVVETYVSNGGVLIAHATDMGWNGGHWETSWLPGGVHHGEVSDNYLTILDPTHPVVAGLPGGGPVSDTELDEWFWSTHGFFTGLLPGTESVIGITVDPANQPTYLQYPYGNGHVLATMQPLEWVWPGCGGQDLPNAVAGRNLLRNEILEAEQKVGGEYTLTMEASPPEGGTTVPSPGPHTYDSGTVVDIEADPSPGWCFVGWSGDPDCSDGSVTMDHDMTCIANFSTTCPEEAVVAIGSASGAQGEEVTVPLEVRDVPSPGVAAGAVEIVYGPGLTPAGYTEGGDWSLADCNLTFAPNTIRCSFLHGTGLTGDHLVANISFLVTAATGDCSGLDVQVKKFVDADNNDIPVRDEDGEICSGLCGDVNVDGVVDISDALFLLQHDLGLRACSATSPPPPGTLYCGLGDVNCDGLVDIADALFVLQYDLDLREELCVCAEP